jgi:hypothetical protein
MYRRTTKVMCASGTVPQNIRLVNSYRNNGNPRPRIICSLGHEGWFTHVLGLCPQILRGEETWLRSAPRHPQCRGAGFNCRFVESAPKQY